MPRPTAITPLSQLPVEKLLAMASYLRDQLHHVEQELRRRKAHYASISGTHPDHVGCTICGTHPRR